MWVWGLRAHGVSVMALRVDPHTSNVYAVQNVETPYNRDMFLVS